MFKWIGKDSDTAAAAMVVARKCFRDMPIDQAIHETLHTGLLCRSPDEMPEREITRFRLMVDEHLLKSDERRKENQMTTLGTSGIESIQGRGRSRNRGSTMRISGGLS